MATSTATQKPLDRFLAACPAATGPNSAGWYSNPDNPRFDFRENEDGSIAVHAWTGRSVAEVLSMIGLSESDCYTGKRSSTFTHPTLDVVSLSHAKLIPWQKLYSFGLDDGYKWKGFTCVKIAYHLPSGKEHTKIKVRKAISGDYKHYWDEDTPGEIIPYGLNKLPMAYEQGYLIVGEGESDAWTCWYHGVPYLGLPGANSPKRLLKKLVDYGPELNRIKRIYILHEPDQVKKLQTTGQGFYKDVHRGLRDIGYTGEIFCVPFEQLTGCKDPSELHIKLYPDEKRFKETLAQALKQAIPSGDMSTDFTPDIRSLRDLLSKQLPPPRWAIKGIIPEGLSILAGKPKMGKSWMILQIGLALATGGLALEKIQVERADVLYLALEDNERRLQSRALQLLSERWDESLGCFDYVTNWVRLNEGGAKAIETWLEQHPQARLVVIDTLAKVRPRRARGSNIYEDDYADVAQLKTIADKYHCAIVLIHHLRKTGADDPLEEISGSTGLTGAADSLLVLKRIRGQSSAELHVSGRDVDEQELAVTFDDQSGLWTLQEDAARFKLTQERQEIIEVIHDLINQGKQATPLEITKALNVSRETPKSRESVRYLLSKMASAGDVSVSNGIYIPNTPNSTNIPNSTNTPNRGANGHEPVSAVRGDTFLPLTGLSPTPEGVYPHENGDVRGVSAVSDHGLIPECPNCHTVIGVGWDQNAKQYRHKTCGKWLGNGERKA